MAYRFSIKDKRLPFVMFMGLILLFLGGCASAPHYRYYTLQDISGRTVTDSVALTTTTLSLGVEPVRVPLWLDQKNLTFSDGGVRLIRHDYDRWGEPLPESLTRNMVHYLRRLTKSPVTAGPWIRSARPEAIVTIEVHSIAIVGGVLQLEVFWQLDRSGREQPFEVEKVYSVPMDSGPVGPSQGADSIALALSQLWGQLAKEVREAL